MKIKIPVKDVKKENTYESVRKKLQSDPDNAYTISGLLVEIFDIKQQQIENKPFRDWPKGVPSMYTKVRLSLEKLKSEKVVASTKHGRAWVYWWIGEEPEVKIKRRF